VSSSELQAPKHRASKARRAPRAALKTSLTLSSMAVVATGFAVGSGSLSLSADGGSGSSTASVADLGAAAAASGQSGPSSQSSGSGGTSAPTDAEVAAALADRAQQPVTRSDTRAKADPLKKDTLSLGAGNTMSRTEDLSDEDPKAIARALLSAYGWGDDQFGCLDSLWTRESNWNPHADNPSSSAYGIPQALPGSKMASAGPDWADNAVTQIKWGLGYIQDRYGSPCAAWGHSQSQGFY
jgi:hypothetical protein